MVRVDGLVHLMWTSAQGGGISHATAQDPETGPWSGRSLIPGSQSGLHTATELLDRGGWFLYGYVPDYPRTIRFQAMEFFGAQTPVPGPLAALTCERIDPAAVHPGALEIANGLDDNCNGLVDEGSGPCIDNDGDFYGAPESIYCSGQGTDCDDTNAKVYPGAVGSCTNGIDDNCNGLVDEPAECLGKFPVPTSRY